MKITLVGAAEIENAIGHIVENLDDTEEVGRELSTLMTDYVHVQTGYLKSTIYHRGPEAGATAPYAGYEEERGGSHAFGTRAIDAWDIEKYADKIVRPW